MGVQGRPQNEEKGDKEADAEDKDDELDDLEMTPPSCLGTPKQYNSSNLMTQSNTWDSTPD